MLLFSIFCIIIAKLLSMSVFGATDSEVSEESGTSGKDGLVGDRNSASIYQANLCDEVAGAGCSSSSNSGLLSTKLTLDNYFTDSTRHTRCYPEKQSFRYINEYPMVHFDESPVVNFDALMKARWFRVVHPSGGRASWVDSFSHREAFIASNAPLQNVDVINFWRMVWDNNVRVIVMLTQILENGNVKSKQYWPTPVEPTLSLNLYDVSLVALDKFAGYQCSRLKLTDLLERKDASRFVTHCQFTNWPDMSIPEKTEELLDFRRHVKLLASEATEESSTTTALPAAAPSPIFVHCKAGLGRTGTYIALDVLIERMESESGEPVDLAGVVMRLRVQRPGAVIVKAQYDFCVTALQAHVCESGRHNAPC